MRPAVCTNVLNQCLVASVVPALVSRAIYSIISRTQHFYVGIHFSIYQLNKETSRNGHRTQTDFVTYGGFYILRRQVLGVFLNPPSLSVAKQPTGW